MAPRGGSRGGPISREVQVSKKLSWLLRHGAEKEGLTLATDGYVGLASVLENRNIKSLKVTFEEVLHIVRENDKQRFGLVLNPSRCSADAATSKDPEDWMIRANQGHSIKVDADGALLTPITTENMPTTAVHGTTRANWMLIVASGGLKPMGRNHVHFASGLPAGFKDEFQGGSDVMLDAPVISGMRSSSTILMFLDVQKALSTGLSMGRSENGVILSSGDSQGLIPLELFKKVVDRTGEGVLLQDGMIIKEAPNTWMKKNKTTG